MLRKACVELPVFALQLLLRANPAWRTEPTVLLPEERPLAPILEVNRAARSAGIQAGMKYATALSVLPGLQAGTVSSAEQEKVVNELTTLLFSYSPHVEAWDATPGVFWLDAGGLKRLWGSLSCWAGEVGSALSERGLYSRVAIGYRRSATFIAAKSATTGKHSECENPDRELAQVRSASLSLLPLPGAAIQRLDRLGIRTIGEFLALREGSIKVRFGVEAARIYRFLTAENELPIESAEPEAVFRGERELPGLKNLEVIVEHAAPLIDELVQRLRVRGKRAAALLFHLHDEQGIHCNHTVRPAEPTGDSYFLCKLFALRLYTVALHARVVHLSIELTPAEDLPGQRLLFEDRSHVIRSAGKAFAMLRAELGNHALVRILPADSHMPEERFRLVSVESDGSEFFQIDGTSHRPGVSDSTGPAAALSPVTSLAAPPPAPPMPMPPPAPAVRRILLEAHTLSTLPAGRRYGPYRIAGRWWRGEAGRSYFFVEAEDSGRILWVYREKETWHLHGYLE